MTPVLAALAQSSVRAAVAAVIVAVLLAVVRVRSGRARHAAWTAVLAAMLVLPAASFAPRVAVRVPLPPAAATFERMPLFRTDAGPAASSAVTADAAPISAVPPEAAKQVAAVVPAAPRLSLAGVLGIVYASGLAWFCFRLLVGLHGIRRVMRASETGRIPDIDVPVHASAAVSTPVTVGILHPRVLLPAAWNTWPQRHVAAILAHEFEHIRRRDPLVLFLAHLNRCLFWFHPLAWWLERTLARTAEEACDDAGVRAMGESRDYAALLVEMARTVRARRGRLVWPGVGIDGAGRLQQRIDGVLRGRRRLSRAQVAVVTACCAAVIVVVVACRQKIAAEPLKPDPKVAESIAADKAAQERYRAATNMTAAEVEAAEAKLKTHPEDSSTLERLLIFYENSGQRVLGWNQMIAARRPHLLWLIEHHPESDLAASRGTSPKIDAVGYTQAKTRWTKYVAGPGATPKGLGNAARFFAVADKPTAEQILLRLQKSDPDGPTPHVVGNVYYPRWTERLADLYGRAIVGSDDDTLFNVVKSVSLAEAHGAFAASVRRKLADSTDSALLSGTGWYLVSATQNVKVDFDFEALGESYLRRALTLDPNSKINRMRLDWLRERDVSRARDRALRSKEAELAGGDLAKRVAAGGALAAADYRVLDTFQERAVDALPDAERFAEATNQAAIMCMRAENDNARKNGSNTRSWALAKKYAQDVIALASKFQGQPTHDDALNTANLALSLVALSGGDVKRAVRFMNEAAKTPPTKESGLEYRVVDYLLHAGERESVAGYLEHVAAASIRQKDAKLADAASIRAGVMPRSYQYMYGWP